MQTQPADAAAGRKSRDKRCAFSRVTGLSIGELREHFGNPFKSNYMGKEVDHVKCKLCDTDLRIQYGEKTNWNGIHWHLRTAHNDKCKKENMSADGKAMPETEVARREEKKSSMLSGIHNIAADWMANRQPMLMEKDLKVVDLVHGRTSFAHIDHPSYIRAHGRLPGFDRNAAQAHAVALSNDLWGIIAASLKDQDVDLLIDGASVLRRKMFNILLGGTQHTFFYKSVELAAGTLCRMYFSRCPADSHCSFTDGSAATTISIIEHAMYNLAEENIMVASVCCDNASAMTKAATDFQPQDGAEEDVPESVREGVFTVAQRQGLFATRCGMHSLNLLCKDVIDKIPFVKQAANFHERAFEHYTTVDGQRFMEEQKATTKLERVTTVRMNSVCYSLEKMYALKETITKDSSFRQTTTDWKHVELAITCLRPITTAGQLVQVKGIGVGGTLAVLDEVKELWENFKTIDIPSLQTQAPQLLKLLNNRMKKHFDSPLYKCYKGLSNNIQQLQLSPDARKELMDTMKLFFGMWRSRHDYGELPPDTVEAMVLAHWVNSDRAGCYKDYWTRRSNDSPDLAKWAIAVSERTLTEAAVEHSFQTQKNQLTYYRNRLGADSVEAVLRIALDYDFIMAPFDEQAAQERVTYNRERKATYISKLQADLMQDLAKSRRTQ